MIRRRLGAIIAIILVAGCLDSSLPQPGTRAAAILHLQDGNLAAARSDLDALLAESPNDESLHLLAGLTAFGETIAQFNFILTVVLAALEDADVVADLADSEKLNPLGSVADENTFIQTLVRDTIEFLSDPLDRAVRHLGMVRSADTSVRLDDYRVQFWAADFFDLSGQWDRTDAAILQSLLAPAAAALNVIGAHDLDLDVYYVIHKVIGPGELDTPGIGNLLVNLLNDQRYGDLLGFVDGGRQRVDLARQQLATGSHRFIQAVEQGLARENNDETIFQIVDDRDEILLRLDNRIRMNSDGNFDLSFRIVDDASFQTFEVQVTDGWLNSAARMADNLDAPAGSGPRLQIVDSMQILLPLVIATLDHVEVSETVDGIINLLGDDPEGAADLVSEFVPAGIELDPGAWMQNGVPLRGMLPAWRDDLDDGQNNFLFEWECTGFYAPTATEPPGSSASWPGGLDCPEPGEAGFEHEPDSAFDLVDSDHFTDPVFFDFAVDSALADGKKTAWPVVGFSDPTLGGLLYLDGNVLVEADPIPPVGAAPASNRTINAWLAELESLVSSFLD